MTTDVKDDEYDIPGYEFDGPEIEATEPEKEDAPVEKEAEPEVEDQEDESDESEAADASPEAQETDNTETAEEKDWREKRISKLTHAKKRAEEKIREQEEELRKYRERTGQRNDALPEVPPLPSADLQYDNPEQYALQIAAREKALVEHAIAKRDADAKAKAANEESQTRVAKILEQYTAKAKEAKLSTDRLQYNEEVLLDAGINPDVGMYLYEHQEGPKLVNWLADRPAELEKLVSMSPLRAAEYIALNVVPKVGQVKPKASRAPDPVKQRKGAGIPQKDEIEAPSGYTFE